MMISMLSMQMQQSMQHFTMQQAMFQHQMQMQMSAMEKCVETNEKYLRRIAKSLSRKKMCKRGKSKLERLPAAGIPSPRSPKGSPIGGK